MRSTFSRNLVNGEHPLHNHHIMALASTIACRALEWAGMAGGNGAGATP